MPFLRLRKAEALAVIPSEAGPVAPASSTASEKPWYASTTLWANLLFIVAAAWAPGLSQETRNVMITMGAVNMGLRAKTTRRLRVTKSRTN